jgi:hypothetical protein
MKSKCRKIIFSVLLLAMVVALTGTPALEGAQDPCNGFNAQIIPG